MAQTKTQTLAPTKLATEEQPPEDLIKRVQELFEERERNWFDLCVTISRVYDEGAFALAGFTKFSEYVEAQCPVNYRTAMWAVTNGQKIRKLGITRDQVAKIGFSKFKELCTVMSDSTTTQEALELIDKVKTLSFREVQQMVREDRMITEGGEVVKYITFTMRLRAEAADIVNNAFDTAKEYFHVETIEEAFEAICQDWDLNRDPEKSDNVRKFLEAQKAKQTVPKKNKHKKHNKPGKGVEDGDGLDLAERDKS